MKQTIATAGFLLLIITTCSAQTSYKGLTPGRSSRLEVERVLGMPVKKFSETLAEYKAQALTTKILVQFQADAPVVERIEAYCQLDNSICDDFVRSLNLNLNNHDVEAVHGEKFKLFYGQPRYIVATGEMADVTKSNLPASRIGFYSRELYEAELKRTKEANEVTSIQSKIPDEAASETTEQPAVSSPIGAAAGTTIQRTNEPSHDPPAVSSAPAPQYDNLVQRARASWAAQDNASAIRFVQQAIAENPSRPEAYQNLGFYQLYGLRDFNGALESLRAALARGGSAEFRVSHDHTGNFASYCQGSLWVSKAGVAYVGGTETFNVSYADVKEAKANAMMGANFGSFHIKINENGKTRNFNFAPTTLQLAESNVALSLILYH